MRKENCDGRRILKTMFIDITENRHFKVAPLDPAEGRNEQAKADQAREQRISQRQPPPKANPEQMVDPGRQPFVHEQAVRVLCVK